MCASPLDITRGTMINCWIPSWIQSILVEFCRSSLQTLSYDGSGISKCSRKPRERVPSNWNQTKTMHKKKVEKTAAPYLATFFSCDVLESYNLLHFISPCLPAILVSSAQHYTSHYWLVLGVFRETWKCWNSKMTEVSNKFVFWLSLTL